MHYRAEHVRQQPYGPRSAPQYREVVIEGTWINAADAEPGTPIIRAPVSPAASLNILK
jgi:hypothetical protein